MARKTKQILFLLMAFVMVCSLLAVSVAAEDTTITFDISKGSVTADANGVTGYTADETDPTIIPWDDVENHDIVVTGTSAENNYIKLDSGCSSDLTLTLRDASITTNPVQNSDYSPIHNLTNDKTLTVKLEGTNTLHAKNGRVLWVAGSAAGIHFIGQDNGNGDKASLALTSDASGVSLMVSKSGDTPTNGTFTFENCDVIIERDFNTGNKNTVSQGTNIRLAAGAQVLAANNVVYSNETLTDDVTRDISKGDITIGKEYKVSGTWTLTYADAAKLNFIVTGTSIDKNRITVTDPDVNLTLHDLTINGVAGDKSAFLVNYADPADYAKTLTVKVDGEVNFTTDSASTFNTYYSEKIERYNANVKLVGKTDSDTDKVTITRNEDTASSANVAALGVNLTAENATVIINKNCNFDVTAGAGSTVYVAGTIQGEGSTQEDGSLLSGSFDCRFIEDGREYKTIADKNGQNIPTLLLPGSADLSKVSMEITEGWTVKCGEETLADGAVLDFASAANNTITLIVVPPEEVQAFGAVSQEMQVRAIKGSENVPAIYLDLNDLSMADVDADPVHETKAKGTITILGAANPKASGMEIKGRGNASWKTPKKGYQIKLEKKFSVLNMGESKKWILLPSYDDNSRTRSAVGLMLAEELGTDFPCKWEYVDFYADGEYRGLYILCEKVEIGSNRIDVANIDDALEDALDTAGVDYLTELNDVEYSDDHTTATLADGTVIDLTGGYHLELDNNTDPLQFSAGTDKTNVGASIKMISVKEPETLGKNPETDESYTYIRNFMDKVDAAIYGDDVNELRKYVDLESFARMWLLRDYMLDWDATDNLHIWKESDLTGDGKIHAGPAWDFDNSLGRSDLPDYSASPDTPYAERIQESHADQASQKKDSGDWNAKWLAQLLRHPAFKEELVRQYNLHKDLFTCCYTCSCQWNGRSDAAAVSSCAVSCGCYIHNFVAEQAALISDSAVMDMMRWTQRTDFEDDVARVQAFACERNTYLAERMKKFGVTLYDVTFESDGKVVDTIQVGSEGLQTLPEVSKDGYTFKGWFYEYGDGEVQFTAGTPVIAPLKVTAKWVLDDVLTIHVNSDPVNKTYDGAAETISVSAQHDAEDVIYTYQWYKEAPADPNAAVKIDGAANASYQVKTVADSGNYFCEVTATTTSGAFVTNKSEKIAVTISPKALNESAVTDIDTQIYTGSPVKPALDIKDGLSSLIEGADYTVVYSDNTGAGTATATITFHGNYSGSAVKTFEIVRRNSSSYDPTYPPIIEDTDNGDVTVNNRNPEEGDKVTIKPDPDAGFVTGGVVVTDQNGNKVNVTDNGDGTYTFVQPFGKVTIYVIFEELVPLTNCSKNEDCPIHRYVDADAAAWYHDGVHYCLATGLMDGKTATTFEPNSNITRQQIWMILARLSGETPDNMTEARAWAVENGVSDGTNPGNLITRQQLATMLYRYAQLMDYDVSVGENTNILSYEDVTMVSEYAIPALQWSCGSGVVGGYADGTLRPLNNATRAHAAVMFQRFCENVVR